MFDRIRTLIVSVTLLALLSTSVVPVRAWDVSQAEVVTSPAADVEPPTAGVFRARVTYPDARGQSRLDELGVVVLEESAEGALILTAADQLANLARLSFRPRSVDALAPLVRTDPSTPSWLVESVQPVLEHAQTMRSLSPRATSLASTAERSPALDEAVADLHAAMQALTPEQQAGIAALATIDDDGDGLTNTEESWWCTDPNNPNSDGDAQGYSDGEEVFALLDFTLPRTERWNYGPPFGPPNAWPDFNGQDGDPATPACNDGDFDTIPDYAEAFMVGTRVGTGDSENTDGDKFDDGQELFGTTYCPGGDAYCGYGSYPRTQDYSFISNGMPSWVRPPGDSPFVAAYPVIKMQIDPDSIRVTTKEVKTVERTITEGEDIATGFEETEGKSTTVGTIDTNTHSTWQEHSTTEGGIEPVRVVALGSSSLAQQIYQPSYLHTTSDSVITSTDRLISNDLFLYSSSVLNFDIQAFLDNNQGPLKNFSEYVDGERMSAAEIIRFNGMLFGINPQVLLAVLEVKNNIVTEPDAEIPSSPGFYDYVNNLTRELLEGYEKANSTDRLSQLNHREDNFQHTRLNAEAGTTAVKKVLGELAAGQRKPLQDSERAFKDIFQSWFGEPTRTPDSSTSENNWLPDFSPDFALPFPAGEIWYYTGGPHHYNGVNHCAIGSSRSECPPGPWSSIDLAPKNPISCPGGKYPDNRWIVAAESGTVVESSQALVVISHSGGWRTYYSHIADEDRIESGKPVQKGDVIGHPSCECEPGGSSSGVHVHFAVWKTASGFFNISALSFSGWAIEETTHYNGTMTRSGVKRTAEVGRYDDPEDSLRNDILHSAESQEALGACYAPPMSSDESQSSNLNGEKKQTWFGEVLGKLFGGWFGKREDSNNRSLSTTLSTIQSGCIGDSCTNQVGGQNNTPLNFSDARSGGQCGGSHIGGGSTGGGGAGTALYGDGSSTFDRLRTWSETYTTGEGHSTSHSELQMETNYREVSRSRVNTLVSREAWATATTVDPTEAGTLTFNYYLKNVGSDAAINITEMDLNILIGDLPVITWRAPDRSNIMPGQTKGPFSSDALTLSLEQLAAIDNGEPIRVVLADYGYDDQLYDQNAWGRSVLFHVDDGIGDDDLSEDTYLVATDLLQDETYQDTLARYFDVDVFNTGTDDPRNGTITGIRTPEFNSSGEISEWNSHPVNEHAWWEVSISVGGETEGIEHFKDMPAKPLTDVFLKYLVDSDGDGYTDRAERAAYTDPHNPDTHPRPIMIAAQHIITDGTSATVQLNLQNDGNFDASSVEVWAIAPNDSITITDNLIGGGGRVRAGGRVVLGARIGAPDLTDWITSTAKPYPSGQFEGLSPKTYYFRADTSGTTGSTAGLTVSWSEDQTNWHTLDIGDSYTPGEHLDVADGVRIAFTGGTINGGDTFVVETALPIDTFSYEINRTPHTPPLIVVSYNDPQGNHKFTSDVQLAQIQEDLIYYQGQMRHGVQLDVMSETSFSPGANTAHLVFNNPSDTTITDSKLFVEFATPDGTVAKEYVMSDQTFHPGPNVVDVPWDTADFSPAFDPEAKYTILAFAADRQGTIIENTVKDLSQLGKDELPQAILPAQTWDFGTVTQGEILHHTLDLANTGFRDLLAYVSGAAGLGVAQGHRRLQPADVESYEITLDTRALPTGPYSDTITIRSSDPSNPYAVIQVTGVVTDTAPEASVRDDRPLDLDVTIPGDHSIGEWINFTHSLGPDPQSLHPVKVYTQTEALIGVGKYATSFGDAGTASFEMFGDGSDGDLTVNAGDTFYVDGVRTRMDSNSSSGQKNVYVASTSGFGVGDEVLVIQMQGTGVGNYEFGTIESTASGQLVLENELQHPYTVGGNSKAQVLRVPHYRDVKGGGTITARDWGDGPTGGIVVFRAHSVNNITIQVSRIGFKGGYGNGSPSNPCGDGQQGNSPVGVGGCSRSANGGGGGAGDGAFGSGGGGGYGTSGSSGGGDGRGSAGSTYGVPDLSRLYFGSGGGGGNWGTNPYGGGRDTIQGDDYAGQGAGIAYIAAQEVIGLNVASNGRTGGDSNGSYGGYAGGGGSGGSVKVIGGNISLGSVRALGGSGGDGTRADGGGGGNGRIRVEYCESLSGSTNPSASTQKLDCYIVEQNETLPYDSARLNLPESFTNGRTYRVQYGRRLVFAGSDTLTTTLRVPAQAFSSVTLDSLVSDVSSGPVTLALDIGADGAWDWEPAEAIDDPVTLASPDLAEAFNQYWEAQGQPQSGSLDVPVRVSLSGAGQVLLTNLYAPPLPPDLAVSVEDVTFGISPTIESTVVPVTVTLHNQGGRETGGFTVAFYATPNDQSDDETYIGSAFVSNIPPDSAAQATFLWDTLGFTGAVPMRVRVDPYSRVYEGDEANNETVADLTILTRPDLNFSALTLSDDEPVVGEEVTVTLALHNAGQATAGGNVTALNIGETQDFASLPAPSLPGGQTADLTFAWVPTATGQYRLLATGDRDDAVDESDEGNNRIWRDVHVGLAGPLALDGGSGSEPEYSEERGFGVLDEGSPDVMGTCGAGDTSELTHRRDPDGQLVYRFDHLQPGHFYHLDVTLYECDQAGRQESIYIDGNLVAGPEDLGDGQVHRLSLLVDPVLYVDRSIQVTIAAPDVDGAIVSHISLHDISYRYVDAGGPDDPPYAPTAGGDITGGWLDGVNNTDWGTFSRQSVRVDQEDAELRYRFDHLDPAKRYRLHFTFYQPSGQIHIQRVKVDGMDVGLTVNTGDYTVHRETVRVPRLAYVDDGSIVVSILRLNAQSGAMVNEIMIEEETLPTETLCQPAITPNFTEVLGNVTINGESAPAGTLVQAFDPRGEIVGCFLVEDSGTYGMMRVYGEDNSVSPPVPGMRDGEMVAFRVDGAPAVSSPQLYWQDDKMPHAVNLNAGGIEGQSVLMGAGWNLISFRYEPPVPLVDQTLDSIQGRFSHVLGERGIYVPSLPAVFQSLTELHTGDAYYTYITGTTSINLLIEGTSVPVTTPQSLHAGWNWIGYLPDTAHPVTEALQSIAGNYQRVLGLDKTFDPDYPDYSTLKSLRPGEGYLIYLDQAATLVYPERSTRQLLGAKVQSDSPSCEFVSPTPYLTLVYGQIMVDGELAPSGTRVEALTPRGNIAGCFVVTSPGRLAFTHIYGAGDADASPSVPGFRAGEMLSFRVNGLPATEIQIEDRVWADDKTPRYVELHAASQAIYLPLVIRQ